MTKMWLKPRGEINHIFVINFLGKFYSTDAVETPRMPTPYRAQAASMRANARAGRLEKTRRREPSAVETCDPESRHACA